MRPRVMICVSVLLYLSASAAAGHVSEPREADCEKYANITCTREYNPVCGDDGLTYSTECVLCLENKTRNQHVKVMYNGECEDQQ